MPGAPLIEVRGVWKRFGGVQALRDVSLSVERGSVHGLVGENGAGKSTLGRLIAGAESPDRGELLVAGRRVDYRSPHDALADGVTLMAQELALVPARSVLDNVFLGVESSRFGIVDRRRLLRRYDELDVLGFGLDPAAPVGSLRIADQQKVEIMRSLARNARAIVMDEPTASLSAEESASLFETVRRLGAEGTAVVFVSHFLEDVLALCDTVTVHKDGARVRTGPASDETHESLVLAMIGRSLEAVFPPKRAPAADAPVVLAAKGLSSPGRFADIAFTVRAGEIVGLAGLVGSGRTEIVRALFGAEPAVEGEVEIDGRPVSIASPRDALRLGIAYLPESRRQGLILGRPIGENVSLPHLGRVETAGFVRRGAERRAVLETFERMGGASVDALAQHVGVLSGGNQQRVLFAKSLLDRPRVLLADDPTRGIDVGAKAAIYSLLAALAESGMAVVLISSEHQEIVGLAHRVVVVRNGRVAGELDGAVATEEAILRLALGAPVDRAA